MRAIAHKDIRGAACHTIFDMAFAIDANGLLVPQPTGITRDIILKAGYYTEVDAPDVPSVVPPDEEPMLGELTDEELAAVGADDDDDKTEDISTWTQRELAEHALTLGYDKKVWSMKRDALVELVQNHRR